jgi:hypothetical protein
MGDPVFIRGDDDERDEGSSYRFHASGWSYVWMNKGTNRSCPSLGTQKRQS